ncbi:MAG TPA: BadF/BadG/BcrA/BcrD ATPase family protein [Candidatus Saccharimonadales bacterium]|nr:BadF/BadG/BcrA/BcrD ATPase family protein [Candidatus Saccharimonadales bacterium]
MNGIVAGIDAGGTKTRAFVLTRDGLIVGRGAGGPGNLLSSPDPAGSIAAALAEALAGRQADAVVLSCAGGDRAADRARGRDILRAIVGPAVAVEVTHDARAALYAGNAAGCGVVLIAGTGSVAYGRNVNGDEERAGGWGYLIGDEGSAFWIGKEGLRAASHDFDGRATATAISGHLYADLGVGDFQGVLPFLYGRPHPAPAIAAATRAVAQANNDGDPVAADIIDRGARELARAVTVVATRIGLSDGPVYLAGGAFENVHALEQRVRQELLAALPRAAVELVAEEPAMGAARMAAAIAWGAR